MILIRTNHIDLGALARATRVFVVVAALFALVPSCAGMTGAQIADKTIAVGGDVLACGADEAVAVNDAISHGGASWIAVVMASWSCIKNVVHDIRQREAVAEWCDQHRASCSSRYASADGTVLVDPKLTRLSRGGKQRLAVAEVLGAIMERNTRP